MAVDIPVDRPTASSHPYPDKAVAELARRVVHAIETGRLHIAQQFIPMPAAPGSRPVRPTPSGVMRELPLSAEVIGVSQ